ncbi:hypothetical protein RhiJN_25265 [Ceratobasidium sp. AG-Ba]|nr:hypothetical protein RhiJN_25265 [Ceratobasidium sp. AG-Ba]
MKLAVDLVVPTIFGDFDTTPAGLPSEVILKVYDRRFAHSLRAYYGGKPVTLESEKAYQDYMTTGPAVDRASLDKEIEIVVGPDGGYRDAPPHLFEHLMTFATYPYFENECAAYKRLASLQGQDIPVFYGTTQFLDGLLIPDLDPPVEGILLEVIPGVGLDEVDVGEVNVDAAVQDAMRIVIRYSKLDALNMDVRLGNLIVKPDGHVVMIDFAQSRLREESESDEDWWEDKRGQDELGNLCFQAKRKYDRPWDPNSLNLREIVEAS